MAAKAILLVCVQALFAQCVFSQCTTRAAADASGINAPYSFPALGFDRLTAPSWAYNSFAYPGAGCAARASQVYDGIYSPAMEFTATSGGALPVTSSSNIPPTGISVLSDNIYEGALSVAGELPFVGTTVLEGVLPTAGSGAINHACGNGINAMSALSETSTLAAVATMAGPSFSAPISAYDGLYSPAFGGPAYDAASFGSPIFGAPAYDGLRASSFAAPAVAGATLAAPIMAYDGLTYASPIEITPTSGGALPVSSASAIPPTGISVASDNAYEGVLAVGGELPFVGTVATEGVVASAGAGAVNHACGNGRNAMMSETTALGPVAGYTPGAFGPGSGIGLGYPSGMRYGCAY